MTTTPSDFSPAPPRLSKEEERQAYIAKNSKPYVVEASSKIETRESDVPFQASKVEESVATSLGENAFQVLKSQLHGKDRGGSEVIMGPSDSAARASSTSVKQKDQVQIQRSSKAAAMSNDSSSGSHYTSEFKEGSSDSSETSSDGGKPEEDRARVKQIMVPVEGTP